MWGVGCGVHLLELRNDDHETRNLSAIDDTLWC